MDLKAQIARDLRHEYAVNQCLLEPEEFPECGERFKQYTQKTKRCKKNEKKDR